MTGLCYCHSHARKVYSFLIMNNIFLWIHALRNCSQKYTFTLTSRRSGPRRLMALCVILVFTLPAPAQDQAGEVIEEITVIGLHIKMDSEEALVPVTSIDREELRYQGSPAVLDMILNLPFSQGADGESDRYQGGGGGSGVGPDRATINIRGLGPSRSLVLINGRRTTWSPIPIGADTQLLVDVNMLPFIALKNIDFLRDGAAASYGSDAIAGVMNFETRSDFTGIELSANHKVIRGSGGDTEVGLIGGLDFAGGRGHITTSASGIRRSELEIYQRDWAIVPYGENPKGGWSSTGRPATFISWELGASYNALGRLNYETPLARTLTEWKILWHVNYAWRDFNLRFAAKFVNSYDNVEDNIRIDSHLTHDLHLHWAVKGDKLNLWATLLNFTDEDPPYAGEDLNYDAFTHNPLGRILKLGFTYAF